MNVNKIKLLQSQLDKYVNIPVNMTWDFTGRDDALDEYTAPILKEVIGVAKDFEVIRFPQNPFPNGDTDVNYIFKFYDNVTPITASTVTQTNWGSTYLNEGFSSQEVYYFANSFTKSFFKLDFYDTTDEKTQKNYFTVILPVQQGLFQNVPLNSAQPFFVNIRIPTFKLDYIGDKEGFFIYWLRSRDYINLDTFYMSAKFFDGKQGVFVRMTNTPQPQILPNKFTFNTANYFYYRVKLDYNNFTYQVFDTTGTLRMGSPQLPIKWYEYVNP